jgi:hypothetical protein
LALGDLDHDGLLDVVTGADDGASWELVVWRNDGTPFDSSWTGNPAGGAASVRALVVGDLDHDACPDVISGDVSAVIGAWKNDGTPFSGTWGIYQVVGNTADPTLALDIADLDNDGNLDVASGDASNHVVVWRNGSSPFSGVWTSNLAGTGKSAVDDVALSDLDGDGDADIVSDREEPGATDYGLAAWQNDGSPWVDTWSATRIGDSDDAVHAIALGDLDTDGRPDVIAGSAAAGSYEVLAWGNPAGTFSDPWTRENVGASSDDVYAIALVDLDRDGDLDAVSGSGADEDSELIAWENTHTSAAFGSWVEVAQPSPASNTLAVSAADFDGDGATDVVAGTAEDGIQVWRGDGGTGWDRVGETHLPLTETWRAVTWGQINNSQDIDLAAASGTAGLRAWHLSEGGGDVDLRSTGLPSSGDYHSVALGDVDNDGWMDLVACGDNAGVEMWRGDGTSWESKGLLWGGQSFCDLRLGHVDHDGNLDIVAVHCRGSGVRVWLGDGGFSFVEGTAPSSGGTFRAVALGDVSRDGYVDVAAALDGGGIQVWAGDGGTNLASLTGLSAPATAYSLDLADFDVDGYLDLLASGKGEGLHVWQGDGGTSWTVASTGLPTSGTFYDADFTSVDGDSALDIKAAEAGATGVRVWTAFEPPPAG